MRGSTKSVMYTIDTRPYCHNLVLLVPVMPLELYNVTSDDRRVNDTNLSQYGNISEWLHQCYDGPTSNNRWLLLLLHSPLLPNTT